MLTAPYSLPSYTANNFIYLLNEGNWELLIDEMTRDLHMKSYRNKWKAYINEYLIVYET